MELAGFCEDCASCAWSASAPSRRQAAGGLADRRRDAWSGGADLALLQRLWRHPVLGPILQMQLENVSFTILPAEDPQETHLWLMSPSVLHRAALASPSNLRCRLVDRR
eukprot:g9119.t1